MKRRLAFCLRAREQAKRRLYILFSGAHMYLLRNAARFCPPVKFIYVKTFNVVAPYVTIESSATLTTWLWCE